MTSMPKPMSNPAEGRLIEAERHSRGVDTRLASWEQYAPGTADAVLVRVAGAAVAVFPTYPERGVYNNAVFERRRGLASRGDLRVPASPPRMTVARGGDVDMEDAFVQRLRGGEQEAYEVLLARYDAPLRQAARSFVRTPTAVEEVVQETWLAVVKGIEGFEGRSTLQTWLFRILVNRARSRSVRDARQVTFSALEGDELPAVDPIAFGEDGRWRSAPARLEFDPESRLLTHELRSELVSAIDGLPGQQRIVVTLRDVVGLSAREVCEMLEITEVNQRVLLHRGRAHTRARLSPPLPEAPR